MTNVEFDRLREILFYRYFYNTDAERLGSAKFWNCINAICQAEGIDSITITRACRTLMSDECKPQPFETYYLLKQLGMTVRPMRAFTGIYWQKQKAFDEDIAKGKLPVIKRYITDVAVKKALSDFIKAIFNIFGSYKCLDCIDLDQIFSA